MDKSKLKIITWAAAAFFFVIAIVLLILGIVLPLGILPKIILFAMSVVSFALTAEVVYLAILMMDADPNYFLYDPRTKRNISPQKLSFQVINARMNKFLSSYAASEGKIWNDRVFDNPYLDIPEEFKPIIAYKLLYSLAEKDVEAGWKCFENSSEATLVFICKGLEANGDNEFAATIAQINERPMNIKAARDYLVKNKKYMQSKMTRYVIDNIELFN